MTTTVYYDLDEDYAGVLDRKCKCGHKLSEHGFVNHMSFVPGKGAIWVSQCVLCGFDEKTHKFICEEFIPSGE